VNRTKPDLALSAQTIPTGRMVRHGDATRRVPLRGGFARLEWSHDQLSSSFLPSLAMDAASRVANAPELLRLIFEKCRKKDNIRHTVVCKAWSEVSLNVLWHDVDDLRTFFHILSSIVQRKYKKKEQENGISLAYVNSFSLGRCLFQVFFCRNSNQNLACRTGYVSSLIIVQGFVA